MSGGVSLQPQTEVWPRRGADLREGLEAADAAVEELGRLRVQVAAQFAETVEGQQLVGFGFHAVGLQYGDRLLDQRRIETGVHVVHAEARRSRSTMAAQTLAAIMHSSTMRLALRRCSVTISSTSPFSPSTKR